MTDKNPHSDRWRALARSESRLEAAAMEREAAEADAAGIETCGECGNDAYYRPGVGAFQCIACKALQVFVKTDDGWKETWS